MSSAFLPFAATALVARCQPGRIVGVGVDICAVKRIAQAYGRFGSRWVARILVPTEAAEFSQRHARNTERGMAYLATRFAAKEALAKALGTGMRTPMGWQACAVVHDALGRPSWQLFGVLALDMQQRGLVAHLSVSDEEDVVAAFCVLEQL